MNQQVRRRAHRRADHHLLGHRVGFGGAGYLGVVFAPTTAPIFWCVLLGLGGWCFPLALALIPARTRTVIVTARLSGFVQPVGYILAAAGPLLVGVALACSRRAGLAASRRVFIEDELAG